MKALPLKCPGLLVSVRSAAEASLALEGGADVIDVKEPLRGPLGAADSSVIGEVIAEVNGRVPVSAAMGELANHPGQASSLPLRELAGSLSHSCSALTWIKFGPARLGEHIDSRMDELRHWQGPGEPVLVAYADYERTQSPSPERLADLAIQLRFNAFLIDTGIKDGSTLLKWMSLSRLAEIRKRLDGANVRFALAGSLTMDEIRELRFVAPDWFAVRGAACDGGRTGTISAERVRALKQVISESSPAS
jgi:(5-formylfuran-3-yl)methyl phosphate synthase